MLRKMDFGGNPYLGVLCAASDDLLVVSPDIPKRDAAAVAEALGVRAVTTTIGGSTVVGALIRMNRHAALVTSFASDDELRRLGPLTPAVLDHRLNAVGNNVLANDRAALVNPGYDGTAARAIGEALDVEVQRGTIAGMRTVGSAAVVTNKGLLCHPHASDGEREALKALFRVPVALATANYGTAQVGACLVANGKGAAVGSRTTAIELGRIEEGLGYL